MAVSGGGTNSLVLLPISGWNSTDTNVRRDVRYSADESKTAANQSDGFTVLDAVNAKKKSQFPKGTGFAVNTTPLIKGSSNITISDFLDVVKEYFADALPANVLG